MLKFFKNIFKKPEPHQADGYFKWKFKQRLSSEAWLLVYHAKQIRHQYPDLTGQELVHLVYWGKV